MGGACSTYGGEERFVAGLATKSVRKRPLRRTRRRWVDNFKRDRTELGWGGGGVGKDWFDLAQDRDRCQACENAVMNLRVP
jgi:hypothetical protein